MARGQGSVERGVCRASGLWAWSSVGFAMVIKITLKTRVFNMGVKCAVCPGLGLPVGLPPGGCLCLCLDAGPLTLVLDVQGFPPVGVCPPLPALVGSELGKLWRRAHQARCSVLRFSTLSWAAGSHASKSLSGTRLFLWNLSAFIRAQLSLDPLSPLLAARPRDPHPLSSVRTEHTVGRRGVRASGALCRSPAGGCGLWGPTFCCLGLQWAPGCPQHCSALSLPGPAGPCPVADADPAVPVRQLPAAPAGEQLCVHPDAAGWPLGDKDTVSFWQARGPAPAPPFRAWGSRALASPPPPSPREKPRAVALPTRDPCSWLVLWGPRLGSRVVVRACPGPRLVCGNPVTEPHFVLSRPQTLPGTLHADRMAASVRSLLAAGTLTMRNRCPV